MIIRYYTIPGDENPKLLRVSIELSSSYIYCMKSRVKLTADYS